MQEGTLSKRQVDEKFKKITLQSTMPLKNDNLQLWPTIVFADALLKFILYIIIKACQCYYFVCRVPQQWQYKSAKRTKHKLKRLQNWKQCKKKQKQRCNIWFKEQKQYKSLWESDPIDDWIAPSGDLFGDMFQEICNLCPDFYEFGIHTYFIARQLADKFQEISFFLGGSQESYKEILLPDCPGFIYFSDTMEDLPVIFDTGALILIAQLARFLKLLAGSS